MKKVLLSWYCLLLTALINAGTLASCADLPDEEGFIGNQTIVTCPEGKLPLICLKTPMPNATVWENPFSKHLVCITMIEKAAIIEYFKDELGFPEQSVWEAQLDCLDIFEAQVGDEIDILSSDMGWWGQPNDYVMLGKEGKVIVLEKTDDSMELYVSGLTYTFTNSANFPSGSYRIEGKLTISKNQITGGILCFNNK